MLGIFRRRDNSPIAAFADKLSQQVIKRYPPELEAQPEKRPSVNRLTRIIEDACNKALEFQKQERLGWLGKARLGNHFRWNLIGAGYSKEFAEFAAEAIIVHLTRKLNVESEPSKR